MKRLLITAMALGLVYILMLSITLQRVHAARQHAPAAWETVMNK